MRVKFGLLGLFFFCNSAKGQLNYATSSIPKNLLSRAGAVVRLSEVVIKVHDFADVSYLKKYAITVLNEGASRQASMMFYYDKTTSIKSIKGIVYNEFGFPTLKFNEKNFSDNSVVSNISLYQDDRVKFFKPIVTSYPYTIEYEIEIRSKQTLYFPDWHPLTSTNVALEKSHFEFIAPVDFKIRYKTHAFNGSYNERTEGKKKIFKWELNNLTALKDEPYRQHYEYFLPTVKLAPEKFAFQNISGSFSNWTEYGKWMNETLLNDRDELSNQTKQEVLRLINDIATPKEKAKRIYEYMQNKTRYISVQIGIGGYQPSAASEVDRLGYGDCKGLVNFTKALLKIAGIDSYYSIVYAGSNKQNIDNDFASINQGNHIILCVPFKNDTTWLECTSKHLPFGFLGDFTDDRQVLACTPEGGKLLNTPKLTTTENKQIRHAEFDIDLQGGISGKITTQFFGAQYDNHDELFGEPYAEQVKKITLLYPLLAFEVKNLEFKKSIEGSPVTVERVSLKASSYGSLNDGNLYLPLNKLNCLRTTPKEVKNRLHPVYINRGYYDEDVINFNLPAGYKALAPPEKKDISTPFGKYTCDISYNGNKIIYRRTMLLNDGTFKPEQYDELVAFYSQIKEWDEGIIILKKAKENPGD